MVARRQWTEDELIVLVSIFFTGEFSIGDDAQKECQLIADAFSRTPSSVDRQWRNIADVLKEKDGVHVGKLVYQTVDLYLDNPAGVKAVALEICKQHSWQLSDLVSAGETKESFKPAPQKVQDALKNWYENQKPRLEFKLFSSGSQGFYFEEKVTMSTAREALLTVSCVLIGSVRGELVEIFAKTSDFDEIVKDLISTNPVMLLPTERLTLHANKKYMVCGQPFQINIRLIELQTN